MNPTEITFYQCGKCRAVHQTKAHADKCCLYPGCSVPSYGYNHCDTCRHEREEEQEAQKFDKAKKIPCEEYTGYFVCIGDMCVSLDNCPAYAWATKEIMPKLDGGSILEKLSSHYMSPEDWRFNDEDELIKFIDQWNLKQQPLYEPDYSIAVLAPKACVWLPMKSSRRVMKRK